jgi:type IX secretion system PorP/SprF family membrane protein
MKKHFLAILSIFLFASLSGQQVALNSQYLFNDLAINPAVAGMKNYTPLTFSFRRQWAGIDEAPVTQHLIAHTYIGKSAGAGVNFYNDASGPTRRTGLNTSFSYNVKTGNRSKLSFGLAGSLTQFIVDRDRLITDIPGDIAVLNNSNNQLIADCNFGLYWSGDRHFLGVSGFNLFENKTDLFALTTPVINTLDRIFYGHGGYNFKVGAVIDIQPSVVFRYMLNSPFQLDGNLKFTVKDAFWLAGSYRMNDAISIMGGVDLGSFQVGYAYDLGISEIKTYNTGSHELFIGIKLNRDPKERTPWRKRNKVYSNYTSGN